MQRLTSTLFVAALVGGCGDDSTGSASASGSSDTASATDTTDTSAGESSSATTDASGTDSGSASGSTTAATSTAGTDTSSVDPCTSMKYWTQGDLESPLMHPGKACLACHDQQIGEDVVGLLAIGGTVFPSLHEPDECYGVDGAAAATVVEITTADAKVLTLPVNSAGNFMYDQVELGPILFPIKAKVRRGGNEVAMAAAQMTGDCNSCHTEGGAMGAPGRIVAP